MQQLFIHLHAQGASWACCQHGDTLPGQIAHGPLTDIPATADEVIVFVPSSDVLLLSTVLPRQSRQRLQCAVPYALEEQFIDDVESLHVAVGRQQGDGRVFAAVVAGTKMRAWLDELQAAGIEPAVLMPETLALPQVEDGWTALCLPDGQYVVRSGEQTGFACDHENLAILAPRYQAGQTDGVHRVHVINCTDKDADAAELEQAFGLPVSVEGCQAGGALASLIEGYEKGQGINLRQGEYSYVSQLLKGARSWLPAAVMLVLWLTLTIGNSIYEYARLSAEDEAYRDKITDLYKQTFPAAQRIVNARLQMEQRLNALRGSTVSDGGFLSLMAEAGGALAKVKGLDLQNLSYKQGKLDLDLKLVDLQQLDDLKQQLIAIKGIEVDVQSATVKDNRLESRIRIGRRK